MATGEFFAAPVTNDATSAVLSVSGVTTILVRGFVPAGASIVIEQDIGSTGDFYQVAQWHTSDPERALTLNEAADSYDLRARLVNSFGTAVNVTVGANWG